MLSIRNLTPLFLTLISISSHDYKENVGVIFRDYVALNPSFVPNQLAFLKRTFLTTIAELPLLSDVNRNLVVVGLILVMW